MHGVYTYSLQMHKTRISPKRTLTITNETKELATRKRIVLKANRNISAEASNVFKDIDIDGSKMISIHEANEYLESKKLSKRSVDFISLEQEFRKMDVNDHNFISPYEFDESL